MSGGWTPFRIKVSRADKLFSLYIRYRDSWQCQRCHWPADENKPRERLRLHCSHFYGRANKSVRFDPQNAVALCRKCHYYLGERKEEHKEFFIQRLGQDQFDFLMVRAKQPRKVEETLICLWLEEELRRMGVDPRTGHRFEKSLR